MVGRRLTALDRKLLRDLWRLRGQVLAIAMVIASGVAVLVMSLGALEALRETADAYYERSRFAHVFARVKRAPERLVPRIAALPGVQAVETRVVRLALVEVDGFEEPILGQLLSIPERGEPLLNRLTLRAGRTVELRRPNEAVLSEAFAEAHDLAPGDRIRAVLGGHQRTLEVVGIALSPEFVYAIGPGALTPDDRRFGVIWMGREALAAAYDLEGAFDEVSLSLLRGTSAREVIPRVDALLAPYGGTGAIDRSQQVSNWFLMSEIDQLANLATILPAIFVIVAAFLTNMVLGRLIAIERSEIGLIKAFGYSNAAVGWHYGKLVFVIAGLGILLGGLLGGWFGRATTAIYAEFFRFPFFFFRPGPSVFALACGVSLGAALIGAGRAVRGAVRLPPAEAMRPPAPALYQRGGIAGRLAQGFDQPTRMILRQIARWPGRAAVTALGTGMAVALLVTSLQWSDAIEALVNLQFEQAQHQDMSVGFLDARSDEVLQEAKRLPGVLHAEALRVVPARLTFGTRSRREALQGIPADATLQPVYDAQIGPVSLPPEGLVLSTKLAELLGVAVGDGVTVEVLEGRRPVKRMLVARVFETYLGTPAAIDLAALNRLLLERPTLNAVHLQVDPLEQRNLFAALRKLPQVSSVLVRRAVVDEFHDTMAETMLIFVSFFGAFACMLALGVTYNSTRIALAERARELATLRVLGFSRLEIAYILIGEVGLLVFAGLAAGCGFGFGLAWLIADRFESELYRVPMLIEPSTFGLAVAITAVSAALTATLVLRRLDRLDLIAVLKTRE